MRKVSLEINGKKIKKEIPDHTTLSSLLLIRRATHLVGRRLAVAGFADLEKALPSQPRWRQSG